MMTDAEMRMATYKDHVLDCVGICDPIDWHTFKIHVWRETGGDWCDALIMAAKLADKQVTLGELICQKN
jgi:hypothetical protein